MARKSDEHIDRVVTRDVKFIVDRASSGAFKKAIIDIDYTKITKESNIDRSVSFPIVCMWIDKTSNKCIKAHCGLTANRERISFYNDIIRQRSVSHNGFCLQASRTQAHRIVVFGYDSIGNFSEFDIESAEKMVFYHSKAAALKAVMEEVKRDRLIGGLNSVSLSNISDDVLLRIGFEPVPELFGRGVPMWKGPEEIFESAYGSQNSRATEIQNFINMIDRDIGGNKEAA